MRRPGLSAGTHLEGNGDGLIDSVDVADNTGFVPSSVAGERCMRMVVGAMMPGAVDSCTEVSVPVPGRISNN